MIPNVMEMIPVSFISFHIEILIMLNFSCADLKVPYHIDGGQPSYLIIAGLVFTPLSEPLIGYDIFDSSHLAVYNSTYKFFTVRILILIIIYFDSPLY